MSAAYVPFVPTNEWQKVPPNSILPNGCVTRGYFSASGVDQQYATWDRGADTPPFIPPAPRQARGPVAAVRRPAIQQGDVEQRFPHMDLSNPLFRAALEYASHGMFVLPLRGKIPVIPSREGGTGYLDATTDPELIRRWWAQYPTANIGIATRASGLVVLDVDPQHGGDDALASLETKNGTLPQTVESITGSGGRHIFFSAPEPDHIVRKSNALGKGLDFPNYVVAPPSIHPDTGREYAWDAGCHPEDFPFAPLPDWIVTWGSAQKTSNAIPQQHNQAQGTSRRTEDFLAHGAPVGEQRWRALAATRNLLSSGISPDQVAHLVWSGLSASPQQEGRRPWSFKDALRMALDLAVHPPVQAGQTLPPDVSPARNHTTIRAGDTSLEQDANVKVEQESPAPEPQSVARQAADLAGRYKDYVAQAVPLLPGLTVRAGGSAMRRKDNPLHLVSNGGASDTWQEEGNAVIKRQKIVAFYLALLFDIIEERQQGAIYWYRRHLSPETWKENHAWLKRLRTRIRRHHKNYVEFLVLEEDGWWLNLFSDHDDPTGRDTEPTVADRDMLAPLLVGLGMPSDEYHKTTPVWASGEWKMPETRTKEWEIVGTRSIRNLAAYQVEEDAHDAQMAIESGIATWKASEAEVMGRAPEFIQHTRHFLGGPEMQPWQMLEFAADLGFFLFPKFQAQIEAGKAQAAAAKRAKQHPPTKPTPSPPPKQARLVV